MDTKYTLVQLQIFLMYYYLFFLKSFASLSLLATIAKWSTNIFLQSKYGQLWAEDFQFSSDLRSYPL